MNFFQQFSLNLNQISIQNLEILVVIFGLIFGSFTSFLSFRLGNGESIFGNRSKCPNCQKTLGLLSLIPVFSFIWQKGKCCNCKAKISWQYPAIETFFALGFLLTFWRLESKINHLTLIYFGIFLVLALMIIIDLRHYFIPDSCQYLLVILGVILLKCLGSSALMIDLISAALIYLLFGLFLWVGFIFLARIDAIGIDDLKFFFIAGAILGTKNFLLFFLLCGAIGSFFGILWQKICRDQTFPFAPAICSAFYFCLLYAKNLNNFIF